jgi:hypothetical protein
MKDQLLKKVKEIVKNNGGTLISQGHGNQREIFLTDRQGRACSVWYPVEARYNDNEIKDLKAAVIALFGVNLE